MWSSTNFKTYQKQFDFTSSEQGKPTYTCLKIDEIDFINIIEGLEGEIVKNQIFQTILCEQCGYSECATGNWVALRQLNDIIFFIPAFDLLKNEIDKGIYEPPYILKQKGAYWLTITEFKLFKKLVPEIDKIDIIKSITIFEIISLYKWDTPNKMFGKFPNFEPVKKNHILSTLVLDNESLIEIIEKKLNELEKGKDFYLEPLVYEENIVTIYLDNKSTTEWKAVHKSDDDYELLLGGEFRIIMT